MSMREGTAAEYNSITSNGALDRHRMPSKRFSMVQWTYCGKMVAEKVEILRRGKIVSVSYMIDPEFLPKTTE